MHVLGNVLTTSESRMELFEKEMEVRGSQLGQGWLPRNVRCAIPRIDGPPSPRMFATRLLCSFDSFLPGNS